MRSYDTHEYKLIERPKKKRTESCKRLSEGQEIVIALRGYKYNEAVVQYDGSLSGTGGSLSGNGEVRIILTQDQNEREETVKG